MKNCFERPSAREAFMQTGITAKDIQRRVSEKLGDTPAQNERTTIMKRRLLLSGLLAAVLLFTAAFAAVRGDLLHHFFTGDTAALDSKVKSAVASEKLGAYQVTVHEALNDDSFAYLLVSFETHGGTGQPLPIDDDSLFRDIGFEIDCKENQVSYSLTKLEELSTETAAYYAIDLYGFYNPEQKPLLLHLAGAAGQIEIPMEAPLETVTLEPGQKVTGFDVSDGLNRLASLQEIAREVTIDSIRLSPFGVNLTYTPDSPCLHPLIRGFLFFELTDGTICTENELCRPRTGSRSCGEADGGRMQFQFRELEDFSRIRAVVLGGTAYPLDGSEPYPIRTGSQLKPFLLSCIYQKEERETAANPAPGPWWVPVRELCEALGAEYNWDAAQARASIYYRGETVSLTPGNNSFSVPGLHSPVSVTVKLQNGELLADLSLRYVLRIDLLNVNMDTDNALMVGIP